MRDPVVNRRIALTAGVVLGELLFEDDINA